MIYNKKNIFKDSNFNFETTQKGIVLFFLICSNLFFIVCFPAWSKIEISGFGNDGTIQIPLAENKMFKTQLYTDFSDIQSINVKIIKHKKQKELKKFFCLTCFSPFFRGDFNFRVKSNSPQQDFVVILEDSLFKKQKPILQRPILLEPITKNTRVPTDQIKVKKELIPSVDQLGCSNISSMLKIDKTLVIGLYGGGLALVKEKKIFRAEVFNKKLVSNLVTACTAVRINKKLLLFVHIKNRGIYYGTFDSQISKFKPFFTPKLWQARYLKAYQKEVSPIKNSDNHLIFKEALAYDRRTVRSFLITNPLTNNEYHYCLVPGKIFFRSVDKKNGSIKDQTIILNLPGFYTDLEVVYFSGHKYLFVSSSEGLFLISENFEYIQLIKGSVNSFALAQGSTKSGLGEKKKIKKKKIIRILDNNLFIGCIFENSPLLIRLNLKGLERIDKGLERIDKGLERIDAGLEQIDNGLKQMGKGFERVDRKVGNRPVITKITEFMEMPGLDFNNQAGTINWYGTDAWFDSTTSQPNFIFGFQKSRNLPKVFGVTILKKSNIK